MNKHSHGVSFVRIPNKNQVRSLARESREIQLFEDILDILGTSSSAKYMIAELKKEGTYQEFLDVCCARCLLYMVQDWQEERIEARLRAEQAQKEREAREFALEQTRARAFSDSLEKELRIGAFAPVVRANKHAKLMLEY